MKYLISYWENKNVVNRIVKENSIQTAIQDHEDYFGLSNFPIISVYALDDNFTSEIDNI